MNLALPLNFFTQLGCGFVLFTCISRFLNFLSMVLMLGFCFKILHFGWRFKGTLRFLCDLRGMTRIRLCFENMVFEVYKPKIPSLDNGDDPSTNSSIKKSSNVAGEKVKDSSEDGSEGKDDGEWEVRDEDDVFALRKLIKIEHKKANAVFVELDKERTATSSSANEAMSMILWLQNEKSSAEIEANQFCRMAEQRLGYDDEVIESLQWTITQNESHRSILEEQLRVYREKLNQHLKEDEIEQLEAGVSRGKTLENEAGIEQLEDGVSRGKTLENEAGIEQLEADVCRGKSLENEAIDSGIGQPETDLSRGKSFENEVVDSGIEQLEVDDSGIEQLEADVSKDSNLENEVVDCGIGQLDANVSKGRNFENEAVDFVVSTIETGSQTL